MAGPEASRSEWEARAVHPLVLASKRETTWLDVGEKRGGTGKVPKD